MAEIAITAAKTMAEAIAKVTQTVGTFVAKQAEGMTANQIIVYLNQLDMKGLILELGFAGDIEAVSIAQLQLLQNFEVTAPISGEVIQAMVDINTATFTEYAGTYSQGLKQELVKSVLAGTSPAQSIKNIAAATGKTGDALIAAQKQIRTLVTTQLKTFSRQVNSVMSESLPKDQKYIYMGNASDNTRDICLDMLSSPPLTRDEIDSQYPGAWQDGGGFNCVHRWAAVTELSAKFNDKKGAEKRIETLKGQGKWSTPQTLQQQRESAA